MTNRTLTTHVALWPGQAAATLEELVQRPEEARASDIHLHIRAGAAVPAVTVPSTVPVRVTPPP